VWIVQSYKKCAYGGMGKWGGPMGWGGGGHTSPMFGYRGAAEGLR